MNRRRSSSSSTDRSPTCSVSHVTFRSETLPARFDDTKVRSVLLPASLTLLHAENSVIRTLEWSHFVQMRQRNFDGVSGVGKVLSVDGADAVVTAEMHPRSGIQTLYDEAGQELVR